MGKELFHMEEGDFAVLFPEVIHHCQVFSGENNKACYLWAQPILCGQFASVMQKYCPKNPVIKKPQVHRDIVNAIRCLKLDKKEQNPRYSENPELCPGDTGKSNLHHPRRSGIR